MSEASPAPGHNGPTPAQIQEVVSAIEAKMADIRAEKALYDAAVAPIREAIGEIIDDAVKLLKMNRSALKITVKQREYIRKAEELEKDLERDIQEALDYFQTQLGNFSDTMLGRAAQDRKEVQLRNNAVKARANRKRTEPPPSVDDEPTAPGADQAAE